MPTSISLSTASAYFIGLKPSYRSGSSRSPYFITYAFDWIPALCLSNRTSGSSPVMPTYTQGLPST